MGLEAPIDRHSEHILTEWCDYNGHLNVAYFVLIFDNATEVFYPLAGLGAPYRKRTGDSTFAVESHITYGGEGNDGDLVRVTSQLLGFDEKRIHYFHTMYNETTGRRMSTLEQLAMHVDLSQRKVKIMPQDCQDKLAEMWASHSAMDIPKEVGSVMRVGSKKSG